MMKARKRKVTGCHGGKGYFKNYMEVFDILMDRAELLDKMENIINKINQVKEIIAKTGDPAAAAQLRMDLNILLNSHFGMIDQLG